MPEGNSSDEDGVDGNSNDQQIYHRTIDPDTEQANERLLRHIAELEDCELTELPPLYNRIDDMIRNIFDSPPPSEAQAELEFSYYGYRITLDQTGAVSLMKLPERSPTEVGEE